MNEQHQIHKHTLEDLIERLSFTQAIYYTWTGRFPTEEEQSMFNACLIAFIDHGPETLSAKAARIATSGGAESHATVAAGLLAAGKHHGSVPLQEATTLFRQAVADNISAIDIVKEYLVQGKRIPGFGHRVYDVDPRAQVLLQKAEKLGFLDEHVRIALDIETELEKQKEKKLCLNLDGLIGALLPSLGISEKCAPGVFLVARTVGLMYHVAQEQDEKPARMRKV